MTKKKTETYYAVREGRKVGVRIAESRRFEFRMPADKQTFVAAMLAEIVTGVNGGLNRYTDEMVSRDDAQECVLELIKHEALALLREWRRLKAAA
jgi:hypothetical protein